MIPSRQREDTGFPTSISMKLDQSHRDLGSPTADNTDDVVLYDDEDSEDLSSISSFEEEEAEWKVIMEKIGDWLPSLEIVNTVKQYISRPDKWSVLMDDLIAALVLLGTPSKSLNKSKKKIMAFFSFSLSVSFLRVLQSC